MLHEERVRAELEPIKDCCARTLHVGLDGRHGEERVAGIDGPSLPGCEVSSGLERALPVEWRKVV